MTDKPTHASVTDEACCCGYLQRAAEDPDNPIIFDEHTNEYQFAYQEPGLEGRSTLIIYHCPFCGGCAPQSNRDLLFAVIPSSEEARLLEILAPVETLQDAQALFGDPDFDGFMTIRDSEKDGSGPLIENQRTIRYEDLSEFADIVITERRDGRVFFRLQGKYLGGSHSRS